MLGEAIRHLKSLPFDAAQRADVFEALAKQIENQSGGAWSAARGTGTDGKERPSSLPLMGISFEAHSEEGLTLFGKEFAQTSTYSNRLTNRRHEWASAVRFFTAMKQCVSSSRFRTR
jgi:hypothetical protein